MKTPSLRLVLKEEWVPRVPEVLSALVHRTLGDIVRSVVFLYEASFFHSDYSPEDAALARRARAVMPEPAECCPWVARIVLDHTLLMQMDMTPLDVACHVQRNAPLYAIASDEDAPEYLLRLRPTALLPGSQGASACSPEDRAALCAAAEALVLKACRDTTLRGLRSLSAAALVEETMQELDERGDVRSKSVVVLETQGGGLARAMSLGMFQARLCSSNDVHNVFHVLGVEAACAVLFEQIKQTLQFDGSYTNERHLALLCSFCTSQGSLLPISRHGINRSADSGALSRASFEEVSDQLLEAAAYGDVESTNAFTPERRALGRSPAIMVGQRASNVGTGICYTLSSLPEQDAECTSDDDVVFTTVEADIQMLSYQQEATRTEAPYSDAAAGLGLPAALRHSYITSLPSQIKGYAPSSPKVLVSGKKRPYEPSSPRS